LGSFLSEEGYDVITASSKKNKFLRLVEMLLAVLVHGKTVKVVLIDTYSTQNFYFAVAVANVCRLLRVPYIPILRGGDLPNRLQRSERHCRRLFHGAKVNVAPSAYLLDAFQKEGYSNVVYIPNTIQLENYPFKLRPQLRPRLLWVRSFAEIYNPMLALRIVKSLRNKGIESTLCMIGPDKDGSMKACKEVASAEGLAVTFTGKLSKKAWTERAAHYDIFMNTTNFDNTPVSVIEAMALGLPVISTDVGGVPYLIETGTTGILTPPNDVDAFTNAIETLLQKSEKATAMATAARAQVAEYDWEVVKEKWFPLFDE
tara:strand:+ start:6595 stop:7539 length:945 start_codon:yes stop_codon:yes gene_type:complete